MYQKVQLTWNVLVPPHKLNSKGLLPKGAFIKFLCKNLSKKRATKDHGYFVALSTLENIGKGKVRLSGYVLFPVTFNCITFKTFKGEILQGKVYRVRKSGVFLNCGPMKKVFLPVLKMADYRHIPGENPIFMNDKLSRIEKNVEIRFMVLSSKWNWAHRVFDTLVSLEGDYLGPVS